jgi:hypothetical protein
MDCNYRNQNSGLDIDLNGYLLQCISISKRKCSLLVVRPPDPDPSFL